jgi:hypothetical protein
MMRNVETGIIAHSQAIKNFNQKYIDSLEFRAKHHQYLINVLAIFQGKNLTKITDSTVYCANLHHNYIITVLIENIHYRLPDLGIIQYSEGIYILHQCLRGIKAIFSVYQSINISFEEEMIGFNK